MQSARISVIIPTYNAMSNGKRLDLALSALRNQTVGPWEIVIVDNFSSDSTEEVAETFGARVLKVAGPIAVANNHGIERSTGDYLFFLDSDQIVPSTFIEECNSLINNCGSEVIGYKQLFVSEFDFNVMSPCEYLRNIESLLGREPSDGIYLYSRRLIGTGRYEEDIPVMGMEDYFFRKKVLAKKPKIGYTRTPLLHYHDSTFRWFIRRSYNYGTTFRRTIRIDFRKSSAVNDYLIFTKSQTDSKIKLPFKPIALLFPFFLLLKYAAFGLGFLIS